MAKYVVTGNTVKLNGTDISSSVARAELVVNAAEVDVTDFGSRGYTEVIGGLKSGSVSLDFHSDFGAGGVSNTFNSLLGTIGTVTIIAGNGTAASTATPAYEAAVLINSFSPVSGAVGDLSTFSVTFPTTGAVTVTASTAAGTAL
ncbi:MAG: hypothetical protein EBS38_02720 [Actinobacteria bacterium]|nr:hypothetical protein [Actinomycetota bacterium]